MNNLTPRPDSETDTPPPATKRPIPAKKKAPGKIGSIGSKDKISKIKTSGSPNADPGAASDDIKAGKKAPADIDLNPKTNDNPNGVVSESVSQPAVVAFGRMNPPTHGHSKLINKVHEVAAKTNGKPMVFLSRTHDKKNPLQYPDKLKYAKKAFGSVIKHHDDANTFFGAVKHAASLGHKEVHVVTGGDRHEEISNLLHKYNGPDKEYNVKLHIHNAGDRDENAAGSTGMSASKARAHAAAGNVTKFRHCLPKALHSDSGDIIRKVRNGMNIHESHTAAQLKAALDDHETNAFKTLNAKARVSKTFGDVLRRGRGTTTDSGLLGDLAKVKEKLAHRAHRHLQAAKVADHMLMKKAAQYNESIDTLFEVYDRGAAAWSAETSKLTQAQYAYGRVNSYLAKGLAYRLDSDLHENTDCPPGHTVFYHGTHKDNIDDIKKNGLNRMDQKTDRISLTKDFNTAHGYASMSGSGGEAGFRAAGAKAKHTPEEDRRVVKLHVPNDWLHKHRDHEYDKHNKSSEVAQRYNLHPDAMSEVRINRPVPAKFIAGVEQKKLKDKDTPKPVSKHSALAAKFMQKFGKK